MDGTFKGASNYVLAAEVAHPKGLPSFCVLRCVYVARIELME